MGIVLPDFVRTLIYANMGTGTIASTFSDTAMNGEYLFNDITAGNYSFRFITEDTIHLAAQHFY